MCMSTGIIGIINNPSTSINHHSSGATHIVSSLFGGQILSDKDDWDSFQTLIIYHGPNFRPGTFNIIGGMNDGVIKRCEKLYNSTVPEIYTLDGFQLNEFATKRKLPQFQDFRTMPEINLPQKSKIVIGDSHALSVWPHNEYSISRTDGKTLYGYLKNPRDLSEFDHTILYFGNIDIRFHLCRQENPYTATYELIQRYCEYASKYNSTITNFLPVEYEDRAIPKSGMYKGQRFFGSRELRAELVDRANDIMNASGLNTIKWPDYFTDENGVLRKEVLEPRQSVHIRPLHYIRNQKEQR